MIFCLKKGFGAGRKGKGKGRKKSCIIMAWHMNLRSIGLILARRSGFGRHALICYENNRGRLFCKCTTTFSSLLLPVALRGIQAFSRASLVSINTVDFYMAK